MNILYRNTPLVVSWNLLIWPFEPFDWLEKLQADLFVNMIQSGLLDTKWYYHDQGLWFWYQMDIRRSEVSLWTWTKNTICTSNRSANHSEYEFHILMVSWQEMEKISWFLKNTICTSNWSANHSEYEFHILMVSWQEMEKSADFSKIQYAPQID